jgi:hypothetical protein
MSNENSAFEMSEEDALNEAPVNTPKQPVEVLPEVTAADVPDEDQVLAYTHQQRKRIVKELTEKGVPVTDTKQMSILLGTLDGMDRQALSRKRMNADKEIAKGQQDANAELLASVLKNIPNVARPPEGTPISGEQAAPRLPDNIQAGTLVEGQTEKAPPQDTYQSFMARNVNPNKPA